MREKFEGQDFESLAHLVQRMSAFESQHWTLRKEKYLKGTAAMTDPYDVDSDRDEEVATAEWTWGKAPASCSWVKKKMFTTLMSRKLIGSLTYCWRRSS